MEYCHAGSYILQENCGSSTEAGIPRSVATVCLNKALRLVKVVIGPGTANHSALFQHNYHY